MSLEGILGKSLKTQNRSGSDRAKARRIAKSMGVSVEAHREPGIGMEYWIDDDRLGDDKYCASWAEVIDKLESLN